MDTSILVGVIAAIATVLSASLPYYLTKRNELNVKIKEIKLKRYDELLLKLTEYLARYSAQDNKALHQFIVAYNQATGYGAKGVIEACDRFLSVIGESNVETVNEAIRDIFKAIRKDINPKAPYSKFDVFTIQIDDR